jgi:hypothetical protein
MVKRKKVQKVKQRSTKEEFIVVCPFVLVLLSIVLSVLLPNMDSD